MRLSLNGTLAGCIALSDVRFAAGLDVHEAAVLLVLSHLVLHFAQLGMDEPDTVFDELRRALRYLVLVLDDATLVGFKEAVEDVVGTLNVGVGASNAHKGTLLVDFATGHLII